METGITRLDMADDAAGGTRRPFAKAVRAGDFVFVSGQVPAVDGEIVAGGIVEQGPNGSSQTSSPRSTLRIAGWNTWSRSMSGWMILAISPASMPYSNATSAIIRLPAPPSSPRSWSTRRLKWT